MNKKILLMTVAVLLSVAGAQAQFSGGNGNQGTPYLISSKADMETLATQVEAGFTYSGKYFLLTQDLVLFNTIITTVGTTSTKPFSGNFNGAGHEININIQTTANVTVGLFGYVSNATIENLTLSGNLTASVKPGYSGSRYSAGICYSASNSIIKNCCNSANVTAISIDGGSCNSGAAGVCLKASNTTIISCCNTGVISSVANAQGSVQTSSSACGICGSATIKNCWNSGNISSSSSASSSTSSYAGGIGGSTITNCYNTGNVSSTATKKSNSIAYAGGISAQNANITNCYNKGNITSSEAAGGIIGTKGSTNSVANCFSANEDIVASSVSAAGRIQATATGGTIANCYALSTIMLNHTDDYDQKTANQKNGQDIDVSSLQNEQWITQNLGWDFEAVWKIEPNQYPTLYKYATNIDFSLPSMSYGEETILYATTNNPISPIIYESSNNSIAEISGNTLIARKAGTVTITARQAANGDYSGGKKIVDLTIQKRPLTITANSESMLFGSTPPNYTCQYFGFINNETESVLTQLPTLTCMATSQSNAGTYNIVPSNAAAQNYSFTYKNGILTVEKRNLTVTPNNISREYGTANPVFTLSYNGFVNGNTTADITPPIAYTTATVYSNVGEYNITCSGGNATNYNFTYGTGTLTITKTNPTYTIPIGLTAIEGTLLSTVLLPAGWTWQNPTTLVGSSGARIHLATFTPSDTYNYNTLTNIELTVIVNSTFVPVHANKLQIYPNPTTGQLTIDNEQLTINNVEIFDIYGRKQFSILNSQFSIEKIDVSALARGIYFLKVYTDKGVMVSKFVKE